VNDFEEQVAGCSAGTPGRFASDGLKYSIGAVYFEEQVAGCSAGTPGRFASDGLKYSIGAVYSSVWLFQHEFFLHRLFRSSS
jgi:hypothetical protein